MADDEAKQIASRVEAQRQAQHANAGMAGAVMRNPDFQIVTGNHPSLGDMDQLSAQPGTPGYYAKLASSTRPAPDAPSSLILPDQNISMTPANPLVGVNATEPSSKRVAIYVGRGDDFVVAVEEAPEWDAVDQWKLAPNLLLALVPILRALGLKISDKSGGEFKALERNELG